MIFQGPRAAGGLVGGHGDAVDDLGAGEDEDEDEAAGHGAGSFMVKVAVTSRAGWPPMVTSRVVGVLG